MKVYLDIIANHTADVIAYRECATDRCPYRSRAEYPYSASRRFDMAQHINEGFKGDDGVNATPGTSRSSRAPTRIHAVPAGGGRSG